MFHEINENTWDRKEIFDAFYGYTYAMTVQLDMTELHAQLKEYGYKFYPTICWLITKTVNSDVDYRYGRVNGIIGYYDQMNTSYTLRRSAKPHLFTHMVTEYNEDFETYYSSSLRIKRNQRRRTGCIIMKMPDRTASMCPPHRILPLRRFLTRFRIRFINVVETICVIRRLRPSDVSMRKTAAGCCRLLEVSIMQSMTDTMRRNFSGYCRKILQKE